LRANVTAQAEPAPKPAPHERTPPAQAKQIKAVGLRYVSADSLSLTRVKRGKGWSYRHPDGRTIRDPTLIDRLDKLAVPPAYEDVRYSADPRAHLQATGRDAAGRLQYRYHADWEKVREHSKARRIGQLVASLPRIRRALTQTLAGREPTRAFALASTIELVSRSAIRAGSESYARTSGARGATTLLKSNVMVNGKGVRLAFRAKGGKDVTRDVDSPRLAKALKVLRELPGKRMFQYREPGGEIRPIRRGEVNEFLEQVAGVRITLKDFRTLVASAAVLQELASCEPAKNERTRKRQVNDAIKLAAEELANTPAICKRSYVHDTVIAAFESGQLSRFAAKLKSTRSPAGRERALAAILKRAA
jgi:DNA topoisomerase-1